MVTRSTWSGGVTWDSAKWMPDGAAASGRLMVEVALAGHLYTDCTSARWRLGIPDFLAPLSPGTATATFNGYLAVAPGDTFVITSPVGTHWVGRVDTCSTTWDDASNAWTTVTGTDSLGALGKALLVDFTLAGSGYSDLELATEGIAAEAGVTVDFVDDSVSGMPNVSFSFVDPYSGSVLEYLNGIARSSNAMMGLRRDGSIVGVVREAVTPSGSVTITDRYNRWTESISVDVDINRWTMAVLGDQYFELGRDDADIALYGERVYASEMFGADVTAWDDWITYGGSQRPTVSLTIPLRGWDDDDVMLLDPFDWVTESTHDWQVLQVEHDATPELWTVTLTVDNLLDLL